LPNPIRDYRADLSRRWKNDTLEEYARASVLDATDQIGRKLVLMVENLQSLLIAVEKDFGWKLRHILQSEPQIILIGSATTRFTEIDCVTQPFFEFFRIIQLQSLNTRECQRFWNFLTRNHCSSHEIRPLEILSGGNPRLMVVLASFSRHRSVRRLMEDLVLMIDETTIIFEGI